MKLTAKLEPKDYLRATYLHSKPRPVFAILWGIVILLLLFVLISMFLNPSEDGSVVPKTFLITLILVWTFQFTIGLRIKIHRLFRQQKTLQAEYEIELTETGMRSLSQYGENKISWDQFYKARIGKATILVYQNDKIFHIFPRRWFTEEQYSELSAIVSQNIKLR